MDYNFLFKDYYYLREKTIKDQDIHTEIKRVDLTSKIQKLGNAKSAFKRRP